MVDIIICYYLLKYFRTREVFDEPVATITVQTSTVIIILYYYHFRSYIGTNLTLSHHYEITRVMVILFWCKVIGMVEYLNVSTMILWITVCGCSKKRLKYFIKRQLCICKTRQQLVVHGRSTHTKLLLIIRNVILSIFYNIRGHHINILTRYLPAIILPWYRITNLRSPEPILCCSSFNIRVK